MPQLDMFGSPVVTSPRQLTPDDARPELTKILDRLREADVMPLSAKDLRFWKTVYPQMSRWLPAEEREAMCASFFAEIERLERGL
jgi:hypothetical protein